MYGVWGYIFILCFLVANSSQLYHQEHSASHESNEESRSEDAIDPDTVPIYVIKNSPRRYETYDGSSESVPHKYYEESRLKPVGRVSRVIYKKHKHGSHEVLNNVANHRNKWTTDILNAGVERSSEETNDTTGVQTFKITLPNEGDFKDVYQLLTLLMSPHPDVNEVHKIFARLKDSKVKFPSKLLQLIQEQIHRISTNNTLREGDLKNLVEVVKILSNNETTTEDPKLISNVVINLPAEMSSDQTLELQKLLTTPNLSPNEIENIILILQKNSIKLTNSLSLLLQHKLKETLQQHPSLHNKLGKILVELRTLPVDTVNSSSEIVSPAEDSKEKELKLEANEVRNFAFPVPSLRNENQRNLILEFLRLLKQPNPKTNKISKILNLLKIGGELNSYLLSLVVNAVKVRLQNVYLNTNSQWQKVLHVINELRKSKNSTRNKSVPADFAVLKTYGKKENIVRSDVTTQNQSDSNENEITPVEIFTIKKGDPGLPDFIDDVLKLNKVSPMLLSKAKFLLLKQLYLALKAPELNKADVDMLLIELKSNALPVSFKLLTKYGYKVDDDLSDVTTQKPSDPTNDVEITPVDKSYVEVLTLEIQNVKTFVFPIPSLQNEVKRQFILEFLHLLMQPKPNTKNICEILGLLKIDGELNSFLLSVVVNAVKVRLQNVNLNENSQWQKVLIMVDELKQSDDTTTDKNGPKDFVEEILKSNKIARELLSEVQLSLLKQLYVALTAPKFNKAEIDVLLEILKRNSIQVSFALLMKYGYKVDDSPSDLTTQKPSDPNDGEEITPVDESYVEEITLLIKGIENFVFPVRSLLNEKQRERVIEILHLLKVQHINTLKLNQILSLLKIEGNLNSFLLLRLLAAVEIRLKAESLAQNTELQTILAFIDELNHPDDSKKNGNMSGLLKFVKRVLKLNKKTHKLFSNGEFLLLRRLYLSLTAPKFNKAEVDILLAELNSYNLIMSFKLLTKYGYKEDDVSDVTTHKPSNSSEDEVTPIEESYAKELDLKIKEVETFVFPVPSFQNEDQRQLVLQVLLLLKQPKPNINRILEILNLMKTGGNLNLFLLSVVVNAVKVRLQNVDLNTNSQWEKVIIMIEELKQSDDPAMDKGVTDFVEEILKFNKKSPESLSEQQLSLLKQLYLVLTAPKFNKEEVDVLLEILKENFIQVSSSLLTKYGYKVDDVPSDVTTQKPCDFGKVKISPVDQSYVEKITHKIKEIENFVFPVRSLLNEDQRAQVIEILHLLKVQHLNTFKLNQILSLLKIEGNLNSFLLSRLLDAVEIRLKAENLVPNTELQTILAAIDELNQSDDSSKNGGVTGLLKFVKRVLKFNKMSRKLLSNRQFLLLRQLYLALKAPDFNTANVDFLLVKLIRSNLQVSFKLLTKYGYKVNDDQSDETTPTPCDANKDEVVPVNKSYEEELMDKIKEVENLVFPVPSSLMEKQRGQVLEILHLLKMQNLNTFKVYQILVLLKVDGNINPYLISTLVDAVYKRLVNEGLNKNTDLQIILEVIDDLNHSDNSTKNGLFEFVRQILEFNNMSRKLLSNEQFLLLRQLYLALKAPILNKAEADMLLAELNKIGLQVSLKLITTYGYKEDDGPSDVTTKHPSDFSKNGDTSGATYSDELKFKTKEVESFVFTVPSLQNEEQRQVVLKILYLLNQSEPNTNRIYEILDLLRSEGNLNTFLLSVLVKAFKVRLQNVDLDTNSQWQKVLIIVEELKQSVDSKTDKSEPSNFVEEILKLNKMSRESLSDLQLSLLRQLYLTLNAPKFNKAEVDVLLEILKKNLIQVSFKLLTKYGYKVDDGPSDVTTQNPSDVIVDKSFVDELTLKIKEVENFVFPVTSWQNEKQRKEVLEILHLLKLQTLNTNKVYEVLLLLKLYGNLNSFFLSTLVDGVISRLKAKSLAQDTELQSILAVVDELNQSGESTKYGSVPELLNFVQLVVKFNKLSRKLLTNEQFLLIRQLYLALTAPRFNKAEVHVLLLELNKNDLQVNFKILAKYGYIVDDDSLDVTTPSDPSIGEEVTPVDKSCVQELTLKIKQVENFVYPVFTLKNEEQRAQVLAILRLLNQQSPNTYKMYEILVLLKGDSNLNSFLLSTLMDAVKCRLQAESLEKNTELQIILAIVDELNQSDDSTKNEGVPGLLKFVKSVVKFNKMSWKLLTNEQFLLLRELYLALTSPIFNQAAVDVILAELKSKGLQVNFTLLTELGYVVDSPVEVTTQNPSIESNDIEYLETIQKIISKNFDKKNKLYSDKNVVKNNLKIWRPASTKNKVASS